MGKTITVSYPMHVALEDYESARKAYEAARADMEVSAEDFQRAELALSITAQHVADLLAERVRYGE